MPWFRKHHGCPCGTDWWDEWDCLCNARCPTCYAEIESDEHEAILRSSRPHCRPSGRGKGLDLTRASAP
jgi:hypothetical protein